MSDCASPTVFPFIETRVVNGEYQLEIKNPTVLTSAGESPFAPPDKEPSASPAAIFNWSIERSKAELF